MNQVIIIAKPVIEFFKKNYKNPFPWLGIVGCSIAIITSWLISCKKAEITIQAVANGVEAAKVSYQQSYDEEKDAAYNAKYQKYFEDAEEKYHVSNDITIYLGNVKETQRLEILKVSDVEFIIEEEEDNDSGIISWLEVPGEGTFVVDMKMAEYIVDNGRRHILVRVPYPELSNVTIDYGNIKELLFVDNMFNGSYKEGEELAMQQINEADVLIKKEFISNQNFYLSAQKAAKNMIANLITQVNPDIPDLVVEVEFMD